MLERNFPIKVSILHMLNLTVMIHIIQIDYTESKFQKLINFRSLMIKNEEHPPRCVTLYKR